MASVERVRADSSDFEEFLYGNWFCDRIIANTAAEKPCEIKQYIGKYAGEINMQERGNYSGNCLSQ